MFIKEKLMISNESSMKVEKSVFIEVSQSLVRSVMYKTCLRTNSNKYLQIQRQLLLKTIFYSKLLRESYINLLVFFSA